MFKSVTAIGACLALISLGVSVSGCAAISEYSGRDIQVVNPIPDGASVEQAAYASFSAYSVAVNEVADLAEDPNTPEEVVTVLAKAAQTTAPLAKTMKEAFQAYGAVRAKIQVAEDAGLPRDEALFAQAAALLFEAEQAYREAKPEIEEFTTLISQLR